MRFQTELIPARLVRRYKRFLADCVLEQTGEEVTAHCPNPGSMMGLAVPEIRVWLEPNSDPRKKLKFGWRLVELSDGTLIGIDTGLANKIVREALERKLLPRLDKYTTLRAEVPYGENSRIDFLLSQDGQPDCYVEVKSVTLSRQSGIGEFPDSVTARGAKHMSELEKLARSGHRAVLLYLVQRPDGQDFMLADDIDPTYAAAHRTASEAGVETMCIGTHITTQEISVSCPLALKV